MKTAKTFVALFFLVLLAIVALGKDEPKGGGDGKGKAKGKGASDTSVQAAAKTAPAAPSRPVISREERDIIVKYVSGFSATSSSRDAALPPGLAKKAARGRELPPGWQKKLAVGQPLPEDVFKVALPLPRELVVKLPPSPAGTITVAVEGRIVRLLEKTREILDIMELSGDR